MKRVEVRRIMNYPFSVFAGFSEVEMNKIQNRVTS
jgi:hypothetical protein